MSMIMFISDNNRSYSQSANRTGGSGGATMNSYSMTIISGTSCPPERFTCNSGSRVQCADKCNDIRECDGGEDEENCEGRLCLQHALCLTLLRGLI